MLMLPKICPVCQKNQVTVEEGYIKCKNCSVYRVKATWWQNIHAWTKGKYWWARLPLYLWFCYITAKYFDSYQYAMYRMANIINAIDFGIHELGHMLFIPLGTFMTIAGGSIMQVLFPLIWMGVALHRKWYFAAGLCLVWAGLSLIDVSVYAADAQVRILPLVTMGSDYDSAHDWYQLLTRLDMLDQTDQVASVIRNSGIVAVWTGLLWSGILMGLMCIDSMKRWFSSASQ